MKYLNIAVAVVSSAMLAGYCSPCDGKRPFAVFPDTCTTPDGMAIDSKGRLVIAAPNFNDTTKPAAIFRLDEPGGEPYLWVHVPPLAKTGLAAPMGICFGPEGELYVCDNQGWSGSEKGTNEGRLLRLDFEEDKLASCTVIASGMEHPNGVKYHNGMLYVTQSSLSKIKDPSGKLVSGVYRFKPTDSGIAVKNTREDPQLILTLVTQNPFCQYGLDGILFDTKGDLLLGNFGDGTIHRVTFDAAGNVTSCKVFAKTDFDYSDPSAKDFLSRASKTKMRTTDGMCMDAAGNVYVADFSNNAIAKVLPNGAVSVVRQDPDGDGMDGGLNQPGEPIIWKGRLVVSNFDAVIGPDKVNSKKDSTCTLSEVALAADAGKRLCSNITFKEMPSLMLYGDSAQRGSPYSKDPTVIRHDGRYLMYYSIRNYDKNHFREGDLPVKRHSWWGAVAESTDLVHWKRVGDIEIEGGKFTSAAVAPCVKKIDGKIHMFHQAHYQPDKKGKDWSCTSKNAQIWHATSEDGIHFKCDGSVPAFAPTNNWSIRRAIDAEVYKVGDRLMLMYATRDPSHEWQMLGMAWAKYGGGYGGGKWTEITTDAPFFRPDLPWEMHCIEAPTVVEHNGIWYMFYAGAYNHERQQIGVAWSPDGVKFARYSDEPVFPHGKPGSWNAWESGHPGVFRDDDGRIYLFYQGKATLKGDYRLSCVEVIFKD